MKKIILTIFFISLIGCASQGCRTDYIISDPAKVCEEKVKDVVCDNPP